MLRRWLAAFSGGDIASELCHPPLIVVAVPRNHSTRALIESGAAIDGSTKNGLTALHFAALSGQDEIAEVWLRRRRDASQD